MDLKTPGIRPETMQGGKRPGRVGEGWGGGLMRGGSVLEVKMYLETNTLD